MTDKRLTRYKMIAYLMQETENLRWNDLQRLSDHVLAQLCKAVLNGRTPGRPENNSKSEWDT